MRTIFFAMVALGLFGSTGHVATAQTVVTPSLQVCMPVGNGLDLSSNGCACMGNLDCLGVCSFSAQVCGGGPDVRVCAPIGNGLDLSANGCPCQGNNDCQGVCQGGTWLCGGGPGPATAPIACRPPGGGGDFNADGCPCTNNTDCVGNCSFFTRTCGAVVGAIANTTTSISGVASADIFLGQAITDSATVSGGRSAASRVEFTLHPPGDTTCASTTTTSSAAITAMTTVVSSAFTPTQVGTYRWTARYHGNAWNLPATTACNSLSQQVSVTDTFFANGFEP